MSDAATEFRVGTEEDTFELEKGDARFAAA